MKDNHINRTTNYIQSLTSHSPVWAQHLERYAKIEGIPIIDRESMQFIIQILHLHQPKRILEIGTAIGYSALRMHEALPEATIITLEKNAEMCQIAAKNIRKQGAKDEIHLVQGDALEQINRLSIYEAPVDFVFIDAAKAQYKQYVKAVEPMLSKGSIILSDNVLFRGYVTSNIEDVPKRYRKLVKNLQKFNEYMMNNSSYQSSLIPIGDGLLMSFKLK